MVGEEESSFVDDEKILLMTMLLVDLQPLGRYSSLRFSFISRIGKRYRGGGIILILSRCLLLRLHFASVFSSSTKLLSSSPTTSSSSSVSSYSDNVYLTHVLFPPPICTRLFTSLLTGTPYSKFRRMKVITTTLPLEYCPIIRIIRLFRCARSQEKTCAVGHRLCI